MYDQVVKYLASVFIDAESIVPSPKDIAHLVLALDDETLLPVVAYEQASGGVVPRPGFRSVDGERQILVQTKRFDYQWTPPPDATPRPFSDFLAEASQKLAVLLDHYGRMGHRLAAVQQGLLTSLSSADIDAVRDRLLNYCPPLADPYEWDWRVVSKVDREFGNCTEVTNTIAIVKRQAGQIITGTGQGITVEPFDPIRLDLDINTLPANTEARFGSQELQDFFAVSPKWHADLAASVRPFVLGDQT